MSQWSERISDHVTALVDYAIERGLAQEDDRVYLTNSLLETMDEDAYCPTEQGFSGTLEEILGGLLDAAVEKGLIEDNITARDLFDTKLMGRLTPLPREVREKFRAAYAVSPERATDYYYRLSQDTDYIRRYRIEKDMRWKFPSEYGELDITINLSKPEKDPRAIAAAKNAPQSSYPKCQLCAENEGYRGRMNHPARQNHRIVPITIAGAQWFFQYSPYVYYNEHCIVFNREHVPMAINRAAFEKLLDFVTVMPHYFVGSNADLPIVGGSILSHEHFQGGRYTFAMERAEIERPVVFRGFEEIHAGIVKWPMSVIRLRGAEPGRLAELADRILQTWRGYSDPAAFIFAETEGTPHNTITPIARRRGTDYELDLVLRNNITTLEHPLGYFHPHSEKHHIKKENIGLIEVMGLAVLPSRLKSELLALKNQILAGADLRADPVLEKHADWVDQLKKQYTFTQENTMEILMRETGRVFSEVLEDAGVYQRTPEGRQAFERFVDAVNKK